MSIDIRFPQITATDEAEQLQQIRSYLHQLVEQLNWALKSLDGGNKDISDDKDNKKKAETKEDDTPAGSAVIESILAKLQAINLRIDNVNIALGDINQHINHSIFSDNSLAFYDDDGDEMARIVGKELHVDTVQSKLIKAAVVKAEHLHAIDTYDSADFDDLFYATGYYVGTTAPEDVSCSHFPENTVGVLEVISNMTQNSADEWSGYAYQTYRTCEGNIYTRSYTHSAGFTDWVRLTTT